MSQDERPLEWVGSSYKDLMQLPAEVRKFIGYALNFSQQGGQHPAAKVLKGFGGAASLKLWRMMQAEHIEPCIRSGSRRQFLCCIAFRKRARAASPHRKRTWMLFAHGSRWPKRYQRR